MTKPVLDYKSRDALLRPLIEELARIKDTVGNPEDLIQDFQTAVGAEFTESYEVFYTANISEVRSQFPDACEGKTDEEVRTALRESSSDMPTEIVCEIVHDAILLALEPEPDADIEGP